MILSNVNIIKYAHAYKQTVRGQSIKSASFSSPFKLVQSSISKVPVLLWPLPNDNMLTPRADLQAERRKENSNNTLSTTEQSLEKKLQKNFLLPI